MRRRRRRRRRRRNRDNYSRVKEFSGSSSSATFSSLASYIKGKSESKGVSFANSCTTKRQRFEANSAPTASPSFSHVL